ncbi:PadR family transcriptional regulator [Streptomyces specialis]|uniref:PadR family transcriptional regulator n=1 Tax=Streptomyces specialis TaxID=498367 RepID=UPI00073EC6AA|nr:PadR family transcriptional regulator [Streptomyces specialis]
MSIRYGLLALLEQGPRYGSQLRTEFETRTGATWPLNIGQVYTTLGRLERDGLIVPEGGGDAKQQLYAITDEGRRELGDWFSQPVDRTQPSRDELAIKLAMAVGTPGVDVARIIQAQRRHTLAAMQDYTRLKARALAAEPESGDDIAWLLVLEQLIFFAEAESRWLDHCESRLLRLAARPRPVEPAPRPPADAQAPADDRPKARGGTSS